MLVCTIHQTYINTHTYTNTQTRLLQPPHLISRSPRLHENLPEDALRSFSCRWYTHAHTNAHMHTRVRAHTRARAHTHIRHIDATYNLQICTLQISCNPACFKRRWQTCICYECMQVNTHVRVCVWKRKTESKNGKRDRMFIKWQPQKGKNDDYDNENFWISG